MARMYTVGEFSLLTHLPIRTLHHYHEVGVLVPARVDPATGYRRYAPDQVPAAHLARRLRDVRMPLEEVRAVLAATDPAARERGIAGHLDRLQRELSTTATAVASLQAILTSGVRPAPVSYRQAPAQPAVAVQDAITRAEIGEWCAQAFPRLLAAAGRLGVVPAGPGGGLYGCGWFEDGGGQITAFIPVDPRRVSTPMTFTTLDADPPAAPGRLQLAVVPAQRLAVALHAGAFDELDLTYAALGRHVLERGIGAEGPIRESYLITPADTDDPSALRTEICWPVTAGPEPRSHA
jgi:DNA-binding transcriptional MerR regulator